ncbi:MAG: hypothetical protein CMN33_06130 [Saprospirales bacterium]|nr:hypothetical protein [Saprospirales bacterium]
MNFFKTTILGLAMMLISVVASAQEISLLTIAPGDMVYDTYGHSALRVNYPDRDMDLVYNYGLYDFNTPGFVMKFMRGKLLYQVGAHRYNSFLYNYNLDKRSIYEQKLNLNEIEKAALIKALRINMLKENRSYKYDFFFDNCSTRLRDLFEVAADSLEIHGEIQALTYRDLIKEHQYGMPWSDFGIDLIIGAKADIISSLDDQMFLPSYLKQVLSKAEIQRGNTVEPLLGEAYEVLSFPEETEKRLTRSWFTPELVFALLALFLLMLRWPYRKEKVLPKWLRNIDGTYITILGILGLLLAFMWWGTDHVPTKSNWNLIWLSPLLLIIHFGKGKGFVWMTYLIYLMLFTCLIALVNAWIQILPQQFNVAFGWMILIEIMILLSVLKMEKRA